MTKLEPFIASKTHIIWDWNGTLLDDIDICVEAVGEMLEARGRKRLEREEHRKLFHMPVRSFYLSLGLDEKEHPFEVLASEFGSLYRKKALRTSLYSGARECLQRIHESGRAQAILSAANERELVRLCKHFGITPFFDHIYGLPNHHAASKIQRGRDLLETWGAPKGQSLLIGDMDHDAEVAAALGIEFLLLGDGHQHPDRFPAEGVGRVLLSRYFG